MTTWEDFKFICFSQDVDVEVIEACREFIENDHHIKNNWHRDSHIVSSDLGYAELGDIVSVEQGLFEIKQAIYWGICDYDSLGRSKEKMLLKKLKKDPGKHIKRLVLKTYWLAR